MIERLREYIKLKELNNVWNIQAQKENILLKGKSIGSGKLGLNDR